MTVRHRWVSRPPSEWVWGACTIVICAGLTALVVATPAAAGPIFLVATAAVMVIAVRTGMQARRSAVDQAYSAPTPTTVLRSQHRMWLPLWIAAGWMLGTFALFWGTGLATKVEDPWLLTVFILSATGVFALGYAIKIKAYPKSQIVPGNTWDHHVRAQRLIGCAALYFMVYGITQMGDYGASGIGDVVESLQNPGGAYRAKFAVYELYKSTGQVSPVMQVVTLCGGLYGVLGPMLVIYWNQLTLAFRIAGVAGIVSYGTFFLFIGTQKGLGDIIVMVLVGVVAGTAGTWWVRKPPQGRRRKTMPYVASAAIVFLFYMVSAQSGRAETFDSQGAMPANPAVVKVVGLRTAIGITSVLFYPTNGYLGLSYNLGTPFEWSRGLGSSPVVASYATQYFGAPEPRTFPVRTEIRTGWPAGLFWGTIYPWLASDLTFPGAIAFMGIFGWFFARMWVEGAIKRDALALVIFGQLAIAVAYIPANNQVGMSRPSAIGFATLLVLYVLRPVFPKRKTVIAPDPGPAPASPLPVEEADSRAVPVATP